MRPDDYTADAICRAMALPGFIDEAWMEPRVSALRVVLKPSFDNEVCITLVEKLGDVTLSVHAASEMFWRQLAPRMLAFPFRSGECDFGYGLFLESVAIFDQARAEAAIAGALCLDGMGMEACHVTRGVVRCFETHVGCGPAGELARKLIDWSWTVMEDPHLRNALAGCGRYVGREYALKPTSPGKPVTRLAVLGAADDRAAYLQRLRTALSGEGRALQPAR
jgi:hypothetical protein